MTKKYKTKPNRMGNVLVLNINNGKYKLECVRAYEVDQDYKEISTSQMKVIGINLISDGYIKL